MGQVGSKFLQELRVGDAIVIQHPTSLLEETLIVGMVLSDVSASVSSAFSSDLVSSTPFYFIKAPPEEEKHQEEEKEKKKKKKKMDEQTAFSTYAGGTEKGRLITYRVVTRHRDANVERSREDLLDIRAKKKGDRHCM
ncbi:hypothetical protein PF010_g11572 [Phytophthora fragariae]|uniref:Uncharacterized protein n=1 Tax=Phytophthora fragariae TaxID=53985 RepID=A0A6A3LC01_9STRA|nr:hypothetical protein PF003_g25417 [Phytophthora fragariae]KAE8940896.1 hypothetical protein PF009_g9306 [Phytophthora fragariae]KAE9016579.1 hypothetical protein PF011_g7088 [Phytophthora fragariae]KAE9109361.1 hypothetical protein PF010_g11572 [Phytophthora fragariae]KAE9112895.1 hypothetical protein PF007_g10922 [Phytophthora fragariae]